MKTVEGSPGDNVHGARSAYDTTVVINGEVGGGAGGSCSFDGSSDTVIILRLTPELAQYLDDLLDESYDRGVLIDQMRSLLDAARRLVGQGPATHDTAQN